MPEKNASNQSGGWWEKLARSKKSIAALVGALIVWGNGVVASAEAAPTAFEWMGLAAAVATAFGVYRVTNEE